MIGLQPIERDKRVVAPLFGKYHVIQFTPYILVGMVEDDNLKVSVGGCHLLPKQREHFPHGFDVLVAPRHWIGLSIAGCPAWKIDLTRLIVDQQSGNGVMGQRQERRARGQSLLRCSGRDSRTMKR